jgi:cytochrome c oxidase cbb3-type subunit 3
MKFIHYLEKISGVSIYGLSSLIIFGLFFLVMVIWAIRADKNMIEELRQLPLDKLKGGGKVTLILAALLLPGASTHAAGPPVESSATSPFVVVAIIIIIILALAIALLANVLLGAAQIPVKTTKPDRADTAGILAVTAIPGVSDTAFYMISGVILLEVLILFTLLYNVRLVLSIHKKGKVTTEDAAKPAPAAKPRFSWWEKINRFKPVEQEVSLDLGHDYDGIRELDNRLPPWWLYGFYGCILFGCVYMWRYHVSHSAPLSVEEYTISVQKAELQKAAFLKNAANLVDENTVKQLTAASELAAGQKVFEATCFACHGKAGEGGVGPNLTDEYWLHGGSVQEVFKSIKYGWPDKGMKSWKDDFSPAQIAQITSYVRSLQGTHPANAKAPQGALAK